jgi:prepilin signal peptidase PulO-like enzyme (type II secretory pathway)
MIQSINSNLDQKSRGGIVMAMTLVVVSLGVAFLFGIYLSFNFFFHRMKTSNPWRWLASIVGGLIVGTLMAIIDFWIIWPPSSILTVIVGVTLMFLIAKTLLGYPKLLQANNELSLNK